MKKILLFAILLGLIWTPANAKKPLLVLVDDYTCAASVDCERLDSLTWFFDGLVFWGEVYDSISLHDTTEVLFFDTTGATDSVSRRHFVNYVSQYQTVIIPQIEIATVADSYSVGTPIEGLQYWMVNGLEEYVRKGGTVLNLDYAVNKWASEDSMGFKPVYELTSKGTTARDSIIIYNNNSIMNDYGYVFDNNKARQRHDRDTIDVTSNTAYTALSKYVTARTSRIDTFATMFFDAATDTNFGFLLGYPWGAGYITQAFGSFRWMEVKYSARANVTYGIGQGLDHLIRAPLDYMMAYNSVAMNMSVPLLVAGRIDDINDTYYDEMLGGYLKSGLCMRVSYYLHEMGAGDSAILRNYHNDNRLSFSYQAFDDNKWIFADPTGDDSNWSVSDWGDILDSLRNAEDSTGSGDYKGHLKGLIIDKTMTPTGHKWTLGTNRCTIESLCVFGVNIGDCYLSTIYDRGQVAGTYTHGLPYGALNISYDWYIDSLGSNATYKDSMFKPYYVPDSSWYSRGAPDVIVRAVVDMIGEGFLPTAASTTFVDSLDVISLGLSFYLNKAQKAGAPGLLYFHEAYTTYEGVHAGIYDSIFRRYGDTIQTRANKGNIILTSNAYNDMLMAHRGSVTVSNYYSSENSVSFTLTHKSLSQGGPSVELMYTVMKVVDGEVKREYVFIPADWDSTIDCISVYDKDDDRWYHMPGWKAETGYIQADHFGSGGFFN